MVKAMIKEGNIVSRNSYNNDILFEVIKIDENIAYLKGINYRLSADAALNDLKIVNDYDYNHKDDEEYIRKLKDFDNLNRDEYFYLPGKILHIDSDKSFLNRCLDFYKQAGVLAYGIKISEKDVSSKIKKYLEEVKPDILVITGHDAFYKNKPDKEKYKNSIYFSEAVKVSRQYEKGYDKLVVIAGACQSNYEELIKAGATFASSPKRINIHALDPAILATIVSLSERGKEINLLEMLNKTKYGKDGIGGLKTNGMMFVGYPREWISAWLKDLLEN